MDNLELKNITLIKNPFISAITASYIFDTDISMSKLLEYTWKKIDDEMESNTLVLSEKNTKKKTQLHIQLHEITINGHVVIMRNRYRNYTKNGRVRSNFRNQLCVYYIDLDKKKKCHKLFYNGNIHVTGYSQIEKMTEETTELLQNIFTVIGQEWNSNKVSTMTIHMMNMVFKISKTISLRKLNLEPPSEWNVIYNPEIYCGCMVRANTFKANIFSSGSVIVTACKSEKELNDACCIILEFFDTWLNYYMMLRGV
jgi:TATA-box binding protein (TBP) (component of TFIID and TFIIIB)